MHAGDEVGSVEHPRLDDLPGAARRHLLGVLEDEAHLAGELVAAPEEQLGGAEQHRRVTVVAAGVHDAGTGRHVGEGVLLVDRQRIGVGAEHDDLAGPGAVEPRHDGRSRGALDLEAAERAQRLLDEGGGLVLLERELGIGVQVPPPRDRACFEVVRDEA